MSVRLWEVVFQTESWRTSTHTETVEAPNTKEAVLKAIRKSKKYYTGCSLHNIIKTELIGESD